MSDFTTEDTNKIRLVREKVLKTVLKLRVKVPSLKKVRGYIGTGFIVHLNGDDMLVSSCLQYLKLADHEGLKEAKEREITISGRYGTVYRNYVVLYIDKELDMFVLHLSGVMNAGNVGHVTFAANDAQIGDIAIALGHSDGMDYTCSPGRLCGPLEGCVHIFNELRPKFYDYHCGDGACGGPVFNIEGEVIGVHYGKQPDSSIAIAATLEQIMDCFSKMIGQGSKQSEREKNNNLRLMFDGVIEKSKNDATTKQ